MIDLDLPETPALRFSLGEATRVVRKGAAGPAASRRVGTWVELNRVAATRLTPELAGDDAELKAFLAAQSDRFAFYYVRLGCTLHPAPPEALDKAWLEVSLRDAGAGGGEAPFAWSLSPLASYSATEITRSATIGSELKLVSAEVGEERKREDRSYHLRAYREGHADPFWELARTPEVALDGSYRMHMVVRSPGSVRVAGDVRLSAKVERKKLILFPYLSDLEGSPSVQFSLPDDAS